MTTYVKLHVDLESRALERRPYLEVAEQAMGEALDLPQRLAQSASRNFAVMIDEFQFLRDLKQALPGVFHLIRSRYQAHRRVGYVVSGSAIGLVTDMVASKREPFYGFFLVQRMPPFNPETSRRFLVEGFKTEGLVAAPDAVAPIVERCDGLPAWLNYVGLEASRLTRAEGSRTVTRRVVEKTHRKLLQDPAVTASLERDLRSLQQEVRSRRIIETLRIIAAAEQPLTVSEIWGQLRAREGRPLPQPKTYQYVKRLRAFGFVDTAEAGRLQCTDPILAEYLRLAYR